MNTATNLESLTIAQLRAAANYAGTVAAARAQTDALYAQGILTAEAHVVTMANLDAAQATADAAVIEMARRRDMGRPGSRITPGRIA